MPAMSAAEWNDRYPVGTPVTAYPGVRPEYAAALAAKWGRAPSEVPTLTTHTRTPAWELGHGEPVVSVDGYAGGISLEHIDLRFGEEDFPNRLHLHGQDGVHAAQIFRLQSGFTFTTACGESCGGMDELQPDDAPVTCGGCIRSTTQQAATIAPCYCGQPGVLNVVHRPGWPCYVRPGIPAEDAGLLTAAIHATAPISEDAR